MAKVIKVNPWKTRFYSNWQKIEKKLFKIKSELINQTRPSSHPLISSDSFRAISDIDFDDLQDWQNKIKTIKNGDVVWLNSSWMDIFFNKVHPQIKNNYILITHQGIESVDKKSVELLDEKIIQWFAKNCLVQHLKITPLPIGLENLYKFGTGVPSYFKRLSKKKINKKNKIFYHFKITTNPKERQIAYDYIKNHSLAVTIENKLPPYLYFKTLNNYKFVISPPGAGHECHRTWEAIYLGVIPIVKKSMASEYFQKIGVPIWPVKKWNELDDLNEQDLKNKYNQIMKKANLETIWMDYWIEQIEKISKT